MLNIFCVALYLRQLRHTLVALIFLTIPGSPDYKRPLHNRPTGEINLAVFEQDKTSEQCTQN